MSNHTASAPQGVGKSRSNTTHHVLIVGAGLCGALLATRLGQRGFRVDLYERRADPRGQDTAAGRSINLALSARGLWALERVGLKEAVLKHCIPMHGRMIHPLEGAPFLSPYSARPDDYINSVSRSGLNDLLLDAADAHPNVTLHFEHKCVGVDLKNAAATFERPDGTQHERSGEILIGTDGAGSAVRRAMMGRTTELLFNYSQHFLRHGYKELTLHPAADGGWQIEPNALHIWPRDQFMMIALPNPDGSFTLTLFHPFDGEWGFDRLTDRERVCAFFERFYPTLLPYLPHYLDEFFENPVGTLGTIKCSPWQAYGKTLIMGDAAHAIVPFYGQGMNASFEDVRVFDDLLDRDFPDWEACFEAYQELRIPNAAAIADLAIDNFHEMQDKTNDAHFIQKRKLEMQLERDLPDYYSKYSLVTFRPELDYATALKRGRAQDEFLLDLVERSEEPLSPQAVYERLRRAVPID